MVDIYNGTGRGTDINGTGPDEGPKIDLWSWDPMNKDRNQRDGMGRGTQFSSGDAYVLYSGLHRTSFMSKNTICFGKFLLEGHQ